MRLCGASHSCRVLGTGVCAILGVELITNALHTGVEVQHSKYYYKELISAETGRHERHEEAFCFYPSVMSRVAPRERVCVCVCALVSLHIWGPGFTASLRGPMET